MEDVPLRKLSKYIVFPPIPEEMRCSELRHTGTYLVLGEVKDVGT